MAVAKAADRARKAAPRVDSPSKNLVFREGEFDEPEPEPTVAGPSGAGPSGSRRSREREAVVELGYDSPDQVDNTRENKRFHSIPWDGVVEHFDDVRRREGSWLF